MTINLDSTRYYLVNEDLEFSHGVMTNFTFSFNPFVTFNFYLFIIFFSEIKILRHKCSQKKEEKTNYNTKKHKTSYFQNIIEIKNENEIKCHEEEMKH